MSVLIDIIRPVVEQAAFGAYLIDGLYAPQPQGEVTRRIGDRLEGITFSTYKPGTDTCPAFYYARNDHVGYIVARGTENAEQARGQMDGYTNQLQTLILSDIVNEFQRSAARQIWVECTRVQNWPPVVYGFGHSFGGAALYLLPLTRRGNELRILTYRLHTYGAPRACGEDACIRASAQVELARWMNDNDPVPIIPPRVSDFPAILPAFGVVNAIRASQFVHPAGGMAILPNGTLQPAALPPAAEGNFVPALAQWLEIWDRGDHPPHAIAEYLGRLNAAVLNMTPRQHIEPEPREPIHGARANEVHRREREFVNTIHNLERQANSKPVTIPERLRFKAVRVSRVWYVTFNGYIVATPGSKRAARALARGGNALITRLQHTAIVDPPTLIEAFTNYFGLATEEGTGFSPVMNDTQPT